MPLDDALKSLLRAELAATEGLDLAIVFGSVARGNAAARSDLDLAVLGDVDVLDVGARASLKCGREVDVVPLARVSIPLLGSIIPDGVTVYERERGIDASFRTRALLTLETDGPWYERQAEALLKRVAERGSLVDRKLVTAKLGELAERTARPHGYGGIDPKMVHTAVTHGPADLEAFSMEVASWLAKT